MKVPLNQIKALGACKDQLALFEQTFGEEVEVTEATCRQAGQAGLSVDWATENLLTETQRESYEQARAPLRAAYEQARAPLWEAYKQACWQAFFNAAKPD